MFLKCFSLAVLTALVAIPVTAQEQMSLVSVGSTYTCEQANQISFERSAFTSLSRDEQVIVNATFQQCGREEDAQRAGKELDEQVVIVKKDDNGPIFYGIIKIADLKNAQRNCAGGGAAGGAALSLYGAATGNTGGQAAGEAVQRYSGVSCQAIANALTSDNLLVVLAPSSVIGPVVAAEVITDVLPLSPADKKNIREGLGSAIPSATIKDGEAQIEIFGETVKIRPPW